MRRNFQKKEFYKYSQIMKILTFIGSLLTLFSLIIGLIDWANIRFNYEEAFTYSSIERAIIMMIGLFGAIFTFICFLRPNRPIPFNWRVLLIFGTWIIVIGLILLWFGHGTSVGNLIVSLTVLGGLLIIIAFLIGLAEDITMNNPNLTKW